MDPSPLEPDPSAENIPLAPYICPNCGTAIDPATVSGPVIDCPQCHTQFFPPAAEEPDEVPEEEKQRVEQLREEQLSALHIKAAATVRRTAYRERSYYIVGMAACFIIMIQLIINATTRIHSEHRLTLMPAGQLLGALALFFAAGKFGNLAKAVNNRIKNDIRERELEEQEFARRHPPDLSALSDGSQQAKNLEKMFENQGE